MKSIHTFIECFPANHTLPNQFLSIDITWILMFCDDVIQLRLCETRLITLIVTILAIREQVDEDIDVEHLTELKCQLRYIDHCLNVITIHVEHWRLCHLGNVGTVSTGAPLQIARGESNLVVDHDVDGSTCLVALQL